MTELSQRTGRPRSPRGILVEPLGETIGNRLVGRIRQLIVEVSPGFEPGQKIDVERLAQHFGVSVTPINYALKRLEAKGLVHVRPRSGHYVARLTEEDYREIIMTRSALEQAAIRLTGGSGIGRDILDELRHSLQQGWDAFAANDVAKYRMSDAAFHHLWIESCGNGLLAELYDTVVAKAQIAYVYIPWGSGDIRASLREHEELVEIAESGDLAELELAIGRHWQMSLKRTHARFRSYLGKSVKSGNGENRARKG